MPVLALVGLICWIASVIIASITDYRFRAHPRLPLLWNTYGEVTHLAPRMVSLLFIPITLGLLILALSWYVVSSPEAMSDVTQIRVGSVAGFGMLIVQVIIARLTYVWTLDQE